MSQNKRSKSTDCIISYGPQQSHVQYQMETSLFELLEKVTSATSGQSEALKAQLSQYVAR